MNWQADVAVTFRKLVESEKAAKGTREQKLQAVSDRFYRGDIADALEAWYIEKGGFLRKAESGRAQNSRQSIRSQPPTVATRFIRPVHSRRVLISCRRCACSRAST